MRSLRGVGVLFSLLIVGVLGGMMAPLPSEAVKLTLQADGNPTIRTLVETPTSTSSCTLAETNAGYNFCYAINTILTAPGNNGKFFKAGNAPSATARLLLTDKSGTDAIKMTGVTFGPTPTASYPTTELHSLKIVVTNTFSAAPNGAGNYLFALRSGGYLQAGPTPLSPNVTQNDFVKFEGTGTFSPTLQNVKLLNVSPLTTNLTPLQVQVGNAVQKTFFTLNQVATYPTFACDADGSASGTICTPAITLTMTVTLVGPDLLVLTDSNDALGGIPCKLTPADGVDSPTGPVLPCHSNGKKKSASDSITEAFTTFDSNDILGAGLDAVRAEQCVVDCPCVDPDICKGNIVTKIRVTPTTGVLGLPFQFVTVGDFGAERVNPTFTIISDRKGLGSSSPLISDIPTVGQGPWIIAEGLFPPIDAKTHWDTDQIACVSLLNRPATETTPEFIVTTWTVGGTSEKGPLTVNELGGGDTLTCTWHIHKNSGN